MEDDFDTLWEERREFLSAEYGEEFDVEDGCPLIDQEDENI
jgi:hypothetical protein